MNTIKQLLPVFLVAMASVGIYNLRLKSVPTQKSVAAEWTVLLSSPCRALDTRDRGKPLEPGVDTVYVLRGSCEVSAGTWGVDMNVTAIPEGPVGFLTIWPGDIEERPLASLMNLLEPGIRSNKATLRVGVEDGSVKVYNSGPGKVHLIFDVWATYEMMNTRKRAPDPKTVKQ